MNNIPSSFRTAILAKYPNARNLRTPGICGSKKNVVFADIDNKTLVFKFSNPNTIKKNFAVSQIYRNADIPAPHITMGQYKDIFFEEYEFLSGKTLFEAINDGMSADKIKQVYREILHNIAKMQKLQPQLLEKYQHKHVHTITNEQVTNVNNAVLGKICTALVYMANYGDPKDIAIFHSDITPKNTVVSTDGHLVGFLDLDSAAISNINYAFGTMAAKYQQLGFNISELYDYFEGISDTKLNRTRINALANINNITKKMLWKHSQSKHK